MSDLLLLRSTAGLLVSKALAPSGCSLRLQGHIQRVPYFLSPVYVQDQSKAMMMSNKAGGYTNYITSSAINNLTTTTNTISHIHVTDPGNGWTIVQSWQETSPDGKFNQIVASSSIDGGRTYSNPFAVSNITGGPLSCVNPSQASTINEVYIASECVVPQTGHTDNIPVSKQKLRDAW